MPTAHTILETPVAYGDDPADATVLKIVLTPAADVASEGLLTFSGFGESLDFAIKPGGPLEITQTDEVLTFRLSEPTKFDAGMLGVSKGLEDDLKEVRIELRPGTGPDSHSQTAPYLALFFCWDVTGSYQKPINGGGSVEVEAKADICAGFAAIYPPAETLGIENFMVRFDVVSVGLSSGWIPLSVLDLPNLPVPDLPHLPDLPNWPDVDVLPDLPDLPDWPDLPDLPGFPIDRLAAWFADILPDAPDLPAIPWNVSLPGSLSLPLGIQVKESWLRISDPGDGKTRIEGCIEGLRLTWGDGDEEPQAIEWDSFKACAILTQQGGNFEYKIEVTAVSWHYPKADDQEAGPYSIGLPFNLLTLTANCWFVRLGAHLEGGDTPRICFEALVEIGGFEVSSALAGGDKKPLYKTDLRLLMRDLTVVSNQAGDQDIRLFETLSGAYQIEAFQPYEDKPIPAYSFADDLITPKQPGTPNEYGLTFLDGVFRKGERVYVAWKQKGNQAIKALAHDLLGREAAGALPEDAEEVAVGLEIAWFTADAGEDMQIRLDWTSMDKALALAQTALPAPAEQTAVDETDENAAEICIDSGALTTGIKLPQGVDGFGDLSATTAGKNPLVLSLPGLRMVLARPDVQTLIYRRNAQNADSMAYLLQWDPGSLPKAGGGGAIAIAQLGFATKTAAGGRDVQETGGADGSEASFLDLFLGHHVAAGEVAQPEALQVLGWTEGQGPSFFQVYRRDAMRLPRLLPKNLNEISDVPGCPEPSEPAPRPVLLRDDAFAGISLRAEDQSPWRLALRSSLTEHLMKMFGGSNNRRVKVSVKEICLSGDGTYLTFRTAISIMLSSDPEATKIEGELGLKLDLRDLALSVVDGAEMTLNQPLGTAPDWVAKKNPDGGVDNYYYSRPIDVLGLDLVAMQEKPPRNDDAPEPPPPADLPVFVASFENGAFRLESAPGVHLMLHYDGISDDGLTFMVERFNFGTGGLNVDAGFLPTTLKLPGLRKPFALNTARLVVRNDRLERIEIQGNGHLPELLEEKPVEIFAALDTDDNGRIVLDQMECRLGDKDNPIYSTGTKCQFTLDDITISYDDKNGTAPKAWRFLITGSMQFLPDGSEFAGQLLEDFKSIRLEFTNAPLSDEFFEHVELIAELVKPKKFKVFNLFEMEVRGIGFHPNFQGFAEAKPAIIIAGQCEFADIGDVLSVDVDFHRLYFGGPKSGELLPQTYFKGLRVEIATSGFKIAGRVETPDNDEVKGFKGEGTVLIPGLPEISAAFAFVKLRADAQDTWKRGWFIAIEAARISFQIGPLPLYLRQIGLGFGYRYTSVIIKRFEEEEELGALIKLMLKEINQHQTLARIDTWAEDPERDAEGGSARWSIGLEAVFSMTSANSSPMTYNAEEERKLRTAVAQLLIFLRSDLTFLAAAKVWFPISADDFFEDVDGMRKRPLASGFMIYSAPKNRLLVHAAKGKNPYLGPPNKPVPEQVKEVLDNSHFEATFLSEPGLVHAELGWPDRLFFGYQIGPLKLECRGGVLFRAERDMLVQGIYFSAHGEVSLGGAVSLGIVGVRITAHVHVTVAMRLMIGISLSRPSQSCIYAAVGVDIAVRFEVHAWFRLKLRFCTIKLDLRFGIDLQIVVALELGWAGAAALGFRGRATVVIGAFGRQLRVKVAVGVREGDVTTAYRRMAPYMRSYLEPGAIPAIPGIGGENGISERAEFERTRQAEKVLVARKVADASVRHEAKAQSDNALLRAAPAGPAAAPPPSFGLAGPSPAAAAPEADTRQTVDDGFAFALRKGAPQPGRKQLWFGWIVPAINSKYLYPVPQVTLPQVEEDGAPTLDGEGHQVGTVHDYATLDLSRVPDGAKVFVPRLRPKSGQALGTGQTDWIEVGDDGHAKFRMHPHHGATLDPQTGGSAGLSLIQFLAGNYVPADPADYSAGTGEETSPFPGNWLPDQPFALEPTVQREMEDVVDTRLTDGTGGAPRRALDPEDQYDAALIKMREPDLLESVGDPFDPATAEQLREPGMTDPELKKRLDTLKTAVLEDQAEGNLSFLMRGFMDDLEALARDIDLDETGAPTPWPDQGLNRPTLAHLGLLVCVVAEDCPDWLCHYPVEEDGTADPTVYPDLKFAMPHLAGSGAQENDLTEITFDGPCLPVVDFAQSSFEQNTPQFRDVVSHFDDQTLNVGWKLGWGRLGVPRGAAKGTVPEDFLSAYEIVVSREDSNEVLGSFHTGPGDGVHEEETTGTAGARKLKRIKLRYQFNATTTQLRLDTGVGRLSTATRVTVKITPIAQDGTRGDAYATVVQYRPSLRPMPPDDATLTARLQDDGTFAARLGWRELEPPNTADVAPTLRWDLVLRPLDALPLGAWPAEASEAEDSGLLGAGALAPQDGDLIVVLNAHSHEPEDVGSISNGVSAGSPSTDATDQTAPRDPALRLWTLDIDGQTNPDVAVRGIYDHLGAPITDTADPRFVKAMGFFKRETSTGRKGSAWRVFLRAAGQKAHGPKKPGALLPQDDVSGLVRVRLFLDGTGGGAGNTSRALDHLEWPNTAGAPLQLPSAAIKATPGPIHRAAFVPQLTPPSPDTPADLTMRFQRKEGRERGVMLRWGADSIGQAPDEIHNIASWELFEARMDDLVNFDRSEDSQQAFRPEWKHLKSVLPAEAALAQRANTSFVQPEIWDAIPPSEALTNDWMARLLEQQEADAPAAPGWYSWDESLLLWPPFEEAALAMLKQKTSEVAGEFAFHNMAHDDDPTEQELLNALAARIDVGVYLAKKQVQPWIACVLGTLALIGAPPALGGEEDQALFEVEITPGKPVAGTDDIAPDPLTWMQRDVEPADPLGWGGLSHLGLSVGISLRDPITRGHLGQTDLRDYLDQAITLTARLIEHIADDDIRRLRIDSRHIAIDVPLQTDRAARTDDATIDLQDAHSLSLLQLALRPVPIREPSPDQQVGIFEIVPPNAQNGGTIAFRYDVRLLYPGRDWAERAFQAATPQPAGDLFRANETLVVLTSAQGPLVRDQIIEDIRTSLDTDVGPALDLFRTRCGYGVITWQDNDPPASVTADFAQPVTVIHPAKNYTSTELSAGTHPIGDVLEPGETVLLRWEQDVVSDAPDPLTALATALGGVAHVHREIAGQPLPLSPDVRDKKEALALSPFQRFRPSEQEIAARLSYLGKEKRLLALDPALARPMEYAVRAFVQMPPMPAEVADQPEAVQSAWRANALSEAKSKLRAEMWDNPEVATILANWSARYFRAAPLHLSGNRNNFDPMRLTAVSPKRADPARMYPDAVGQLSYVHPVTEDWASIRSYAVRVVPRYAALGAPEQSLPMPQFGKGHGRADAELSRRRELVEPGVLGLRVVQSDSGANDQGRPYHEVTLADHVELALSRANIALARKLEFQDIRRRYRIRFRHEDWITRLAPFIGDTVPVYENRLTEDGTWATPAADTFSESDQSALAATPMARFGALQFLTPAEPHYFDQRLDVLARARYVQSRTLHLRLPPPAAAAPLPLAGTGLPPARWQQAEWTDFGLEDIQTTRQAILDQLGEDALPPWASRLDPEAVRAILRLPRLIETIPERPPQDTVARPDYDHLPDPAGRLELISEADGVRATIAVVERNQATGEAPFVLRPVSSDVMVSALSTDQPAGHPWQMGLITSFAVLPGGGVEPNVTLSPPLIGGVPASPLELPLTGPLSCLVPLMLRLELEDASLRMLAPLTGPRWLVRPHLPQLAADVPATEMTSADLATGLRLLIDGTRRAALAAFGPDARGAEMAQVETAQAVLLSDPLDEKMLETGAIGDVLAMEAAKLLRLRDGVPAVLETAADAAIGDLIVLLLSGNGQNAAYDRFTEALIGDETPAPPPLDILHEAEVAAGHLADQAWRSPRRSRFRVVAHHGNLPGADWGEREPEAAEPDSDGGQP